MLIIRPGSDGKIVARFFVRGDSAGLAVFVEMEIIGTAGGASLYSVIT